MSFIWPIFLWNLLMIPLLVLAYFYILQRRKRVAVRFANLNLVKEAMGSGPGIRRHIPAILLLVSLILMMIGIARPTAMVTLPSERGTVILAMDISGSMRAADVVPDRLSASQEAAISFVLDQPGSTRVGVVAFAGAALVVQQPTLNREEIIRSIEQFQLRRGTNIGEAILVSLQLIFPEADFDTGTRGFTNERSRGAPLGEARDLDEFIPVEPGSYSNAAVVLLTDGQPTTGPDPIQAARIAADRGVRLFTVGFGSRQGEVVGFGGRSMRVQLDEENLRQVAEITRGRYFHAGSSENLSEVYQTLTTQFFMEREETEITAFFAAGAMLTLLLSVFLSLIWFNRII